MSLTFPTATLKKPSGLKATSGIKRPAFGALYGFDSSGDDAGGGASFTNQYSVDFDGSDDYMDVGNDSSLSISGALSITAWIYANSLSGFPMIISKRESLSGHAYQFYSTGSKLNYNNGTIVQSTGTISTGVWTHVGVTFDGSGGVSFYINGSSAGTATAASTNPTNTGAVTIAKAFNGNYFNGKIDELAVFNTELSASDISSIYNSGVPSDISSLNPLGWWRMGDNNGGTGTTITDQGSGSNDGTLTNGPTFSTTVPYTLPSITNTYSISFDGTNDYMDIPDSTALETTAFTWSAWFYCNAISRHNPIVDTSTDSGSFNGFHIRVNSNNKIRFASYYAFDYIDSTTLVSANTWYHVAATHESGSDKLYVNGSLEASGSASNFNVSDTVNLRVGSSGIFNMYHNGLIDEVSFFNSALTANDISVIYNRGVPNDISSIPRYGSNINPVAWWRMGDNDGGTGTTITNQGSASSIDGTLTNGPTFSTTVPS